jgi:hypothetical protein
LALGHWRFLLLLLVELSFLSLLIAEALMLCEDFEPGELLVMILGECE